MKNTFLSLIIVTAVMLSACQTPAKKENPKTLKTALAQKFYIGTALNSAQIKGVDTASIKVINQHFNSVVAENCMKSEVIHPEKDRYDFLLSDQFVDFGVSNQMFVVGHTLIWHSQIPDWFFIDEQGNEVSKEELIKRMKDHIYSVVGRYKGKVDGWDVVNEAFNDDGTWRNSKFYKIIGEEYMSLAFQFAHEADPDAELYYNDYSMVKPEKIKAVSALVKKMKEKGLRIDAVGMQAHYSMTFPDIKTFEESLLQLAQSGVNVMITELDISVLPNPYEMQGADIANRFQYSEAMDPYKNGLTDSMAVAFTNRYLDFFNVLLKHSNKVSRVTLWGVNDAQSWRNYWPIKGRTDYPLLFDRENNKKPVVDEIINETINN